MFPWIDSFRRRMRILRQTYLRSTARSVSALRLGGNILGITAFCASLVCLTSLIIYFGFEHTSAGLRHLQRIIRGCQWIFILHVLYGLLPSRSPRPKGRAVKWIVDTAVLLTLLPLLYPHPHHPWIPVLEQVLYSNRFLFPIMGAYCVVDISFGIIRLLRRRTNPSLILSASFLLFIFIGSLLLMMPRCTVEGIDYSDALFVSTSAVCITGLTSVDVAQTFTPAGLLVLAFLIQIGGLGVMTFTSFFALFFSGNTSIYSQLIVRDLIYSKSMNALLPTLLYIFFFTVTIEIVGAAVIFLSVHGCLGMSLEDELIFSGFHALSAFCNAGFSNVEGGLSNPVLLASCRSLYIIVSLLVIAGGIGFPILVNFRQAFAGAVRNFWRWLTRKPRRRRILHVYDLNTKIVLVASAWLTVVSTFLFLLFEYGNSLAGMSLSDKLIQSFFNSTVPRSSGFSSVNPAGFMNITIIMFMILMWVGGASQSTAGGIKVNTVATMMLNLKAIILGRDRVTAYRRTIATHSIRRAHAVIALSIISLSVYCLIIAGLEPHLPLKAVIYETVSALFTVGTSLGITPLLSLPSKILLCTAMFLGRVGMISLLVGVVGVHTDPPYRFPSDNIIIN